MFSAASLEEPPVLWGEHWQKVEGPVIKRLCSGWGGGESCQWGKGDLRLCLPEWPVLCFWRQLCGQEFSLYPGSPSVTLFAQLRQKEVAGLHLISQGKYFELRMLAA